MEIEHSAGCESGSAELELSGSLDGADLPLLEPTRAEREAAWRAFDRWRRTGEDGYLGRKTILYDPGKMRSQLAEAQNWRCCYCGCKMEPPERRGGGHPPETVTIEHVVRRADGGADAWENLAAACHWCNNARGEVQDAEVWYHWIQLLKENGKHPNWGKL